MHGVKLLVIPAQAGIQPGYRIDFQSIQTYELDSGLRRNDDAMGRRKKLDRMGQP